MIGSEKEYTEEELIALAEQASTQKSVLEKHKPKEPAPKPVGKHKAILNSQLSRIQSVVDFLEVIQVKPGSYRINPRYLYMIFQKYDTKALSYATFKMHLIKCIPPHYDRDNKLYLKLRDPMYYYQIKVQEYNAQKEKAKNEQEKPNS